MNDYSVLFNIDSYKLRPKNSLPFLHKINKKKTSFECLKESVLNYRNLKQKSFVLEICGGNSVESYFFSIYEDKTGFYLRDNRIRHFHSFENCLKYKIAKTFKRGYNDKQSVEYLCYQFDNIDKSMDCYDYVNYAYRYGTRIFI